MTSMIVIDSVSAITAVRTTAYRGMPDRRSGIEVSV
jgi:hypothetical protein